MSVGESSGFEGRAASLRQAFDAGFAAPRPVDPTPTEDFLAIRVGAEACALRLAEVAGLHADKKITRLPGAAAALLGIAGFRGTILPVYSLAGLLGRPPEQAPRWLAVASGASIALGFEGFEGHLRIARAAVLPGQEAEGRFYGRSYVRAGDVLCPVIDLTAVIAAIDLGRSEAAPRKEE